MLTTEWHRAAMGKTSPAQFVREVRQEAKNVTWPTRKEVVVSTVMVMAFVALMGVFFLLVDEVAAWFIQEVILGHFVGDLVSNFLSLFGGE